MCGIAALFEPRAPAWLPEVTRTMTRLARHRGPDGEGFAFYQPEQNRCFPVVSDETPRGISGSREPPTGCTLALGHRRLSILDLSAAGHQPMTDGQAECWLTFNGEIYNYLELRHELAGLGHAFDSGTDTEVILAAWRQWGEACVERFNGMFAFALFDRRTRRLFAARDRFGVKPLYVWRTPTAGLALASEIKQFTAHPQWRARLNGQRAYDFIHWGVLDHTAETLFTGVQQLRGGELLSAPLDALASARPRRWYELKPAPFQGDLAAAGHRFRELFDDAVALRLRANVPVGSCLSGGLDSSSIVCTMQTQLSGKPGARQKTFSAYSEVARFDERAYIEEVTAAAGAEAHHLVPSPERLFAELDQIVWHQDEPFGSTSIFAQWGVFRLARESGVTVMLDGQGADEALAGYHGFFGPRLAGLLTGVRWLQLWRESQAIRELHGMSRRAQTRLAANYLLPAGLADRLRGATGRMVIAPDYLNLVRLGADPLSPHADSVRRREGVRALSTAQLLKTSLPKLLHWEDRDSMAHGLEARLPFVDYRLVEFCLGLPEEFKLRDGWTKRVLREALRGRLPERVRLRRDKLGFETAEEIWMRGRHRPQFQALVDDALEAAGDVFKPAARQKVARILNGAEPFDFLVWRLISFGRWLRTFNVQGASASA